VRLSSLRTGERNKQETNKQRRKELGKQAREKENRIVLSTCSYYSKKINAKTANS